MRSILILLLLGLLSIPEISAQPKHEVRAAWLTTAYGLDWPATRANTSAGIRKQKAELRNMLDELKAANFNTILFQARVRGDVIYPSKIEPYNDILTGKSGKSPGYDPLAFAIEECHKRGMELHAWVVSIPLGTTKHVRSLGTTSVTKKKPSMCKQHKDEWFLDPGNPDTKEYLNDIVREIISNYDVDGIHLDYIRYPDRPATFPDMATFNKYGKGKSLAEWRRANITAIVRRIYQSVKAVKPWIKVSSSPIGKFRDTARYSSHGWNGYSTVYQDSQGWLHEGIQDILFPMMYFNGNQFYPFALDWQEQCNGRQIVPGLGVYFMHPSEKNWSFEVIERQMHFTRTHGLAGQGHYRAKFVTDNTKGLLDELTCKFYPYPALPPAMIWLDNIAPTAPVQAEKTEQYGETILRWSPSTDNDTYNKPRYTVYASNTYPVDINSPQSIIATNISNNHYTYSYIYPNKRKKHLAITAIDRYGNESEATQVGPQAHSIISHCDGNLLYLPPRPDAKFVTVTDLTGRCVLSAPYYEKISIRDLMVGGYWALISDSEEKIIKGFFTID